MRGKHVDLLVPEENRRTMGNRENSEKKGTEDTGEQREQGNKRTGGTGEKQHMYAQFMERQTANRPETFFGKLKQTS